MGWTETDKYPVTQDEPAERYTPLAEGYLVACIQELRRDVRKLESRLDAAASVVAELKRHLAALTNGEVAE